MHFEDFLIILHMSLAMSPYAVVARTGERLDEMGDRDALGVGHQMVSCTYLMRKDISYTRTPPRGAQWKPRPVVWGSPARTPLGLEGPGIRFLIYVICQHL